MITKGKFWNDDQDQVVQPHLNKMINTPHVPKWLLLVYKEYVYDYKVQQKIQKVLKTTTPEECPCVGSTWQAAEAST
jgi:hypothetical protein